MLPILLLALVSLLLLLALRIYLSLPRLGDCHRISKRKARCLVVLGSGGHTAEMFYDLRSLGALADRLEFTYLIAATDRGSLAQAKAFEAQRGAAEGPKVVVVPRAREVGQSYSSSVLTTLRALWFSVRHVLWLLPDVVLANGPGTCVPVVAAAYISRALGLRRILVVYSESFACVDHLSMSGKILYRFADRFTVQWPHLLGPYPGAAYAGRLYGERDVQGCRAGGPLPAPADLPPLPASASGAASSSSEGCPATAIVTVGSTRFDALIRAVDDPQFLEILRRLGIRRLKVQKGSGQYHPGSLESTGGDIEVQVLEYTPDLASELRSAALVISHAGAGTILDCLLAGRRLVVVPNEGLMANHQVQLGMALQEQGLLLCLRTSELLKGLAEVDFDSLRRFPPQGGSAFASCVGELLGLSPGGSAPAS